MVDSSAEAVVVSQPLVVSGTFLDEVTCDIPAQNFLSPNSMWPSARCLYDRYQEYTRGEYPAPRSAT